MRSPGVGLSAREAVGWGQAERAQDGTGHSLKKGRHAFGLLRIPVSPVLRWANQRLCSREGGPAWTPAAWASAATMSKVLGSSLGQVALETAQGAVRILT